MDARKERAKTDSRLYFIQYLQPSNTFDVLGTTGKIYHVRFQTKTNKWKCSCPDHSIRGATCKHIYFVIYKVLHLLDQDEITSDTIESIMCSTAITGDPVTTATTTTDQDQECAICFDLLYSEKTSKCLTCKKDIHQNCILKWRMIQNKSGLIASCPLCRG